VVQPQIPPLVSHPRRRPNPRLAGWLSLVPGLGQLYNRQPRKAMTFFIGVAGLFFLSLNVPGITGDLLGWWQPRGTGMVVLSLVVEMFSLLVFIGIFLCALTFWYASMHDARISALEISGEREPGGRWWLFRR